MNVSRRSWLQQAGAMGAVFAADSALSAAPRPLPPDIIDCHTHFYDPTRKEGVPWPGKQDSVLYRPVLPDEFQKLTKPQGVTGTIVVEASPWVEDNQWLLDLAAKQPFIVGLIGNLKPGSDDFVKNVERFTAYRKFRGIRLNVNDLKNGLEQSTYVDHLRVLSLLQLTVDVNGGPETPAVVAKLAKALPNLSIVINHCGNLRIDGEEPPADWLAGMQAAAEHKHVYCKVSALVEATGKREQDAPQDLNFYRPVLDALWKTWGVHRVIYGSNWPVCSRAASYQTVFDIVNKYTAARSQVAHEAFFSQNSIAAYRWKKT
ncbi:Amidohydrolase [Anatilimnocola aggregata]|uniref:Amidohydrolase n=1 Tax=Anatilimnocola aggregata TaxID=2528021 RepID=A0A517YAU8_9BACT|nr:amidohydrolase family protein [Anatilimnocola aggregata]QDU27356.1 Amidohydrolase [Anatilimnocola aggregata]